MTRTSLNIWITEMLDAVGRLPADPFLGIKGPKQHHPVVIPHTYDELHALIATCTAPTRRPDEPLHHHRDEAIIRLMLETGIRAGELITL